MQRKLVVPLVAVVALALGGLLYLRRDHDPPHYTGFVEGEERVMRSEVMGRVLEVRFAEGATVSPNAVIATLDDGDIQARIKSKQEEIAVLDADLQTQEQRVQLVESTWQRDLNARRAEMQEADAAANLAERTLAREQELTRRGVSSQQTLDDHRARRDETRSALARAREMLARTEAEERTITLARHELASLREKRELALAQLDELQVTHSKYVIHAPATATTVLTQFIWPGELAQPGTAVVSVLDPQDKYVQIYVPVADVERLRVGQRVQIELDSEPGHRVPGEVSFVADKANFTPEKIETRSDRMGQVYRAKVRILDGVERFQPGTEGNVYLTG
ncbi:MAG TPA: HlyD family efflux transporter periplasmic adaptor subunit [Candidatus Acidoferrales bacterium]|nr:HlyD family efflux transporter periplasmic adaptor subunit [Candidatus Acidoferrales bacterium]